jgi:uncharacterized membrane protein YfcA
VFEILVLIAAGLASGVLNAIAGGGTFISFPALIFVGVPPVTANATATLCALPGYVSSAWGFRRDLRAEGALSLTQILVVSAFGSILGALLLLVTTGDVFLAIVPWLLLMATVLFALGPRLLSALQGRGVGAAGVVPSAAAVFLVSLYGGYFNGGLGIMLLAAFGLIGFTNLHAMNGLKSVIAALLSLIASGAFILAGVIAWEHALALGTSSAIGGYFGAAYSRKIRRPDLLRLAITAIGLAMSLAFFWMNAS